MTHKSTFLVTVAGVLTALFINGAIGHIAQPLTHNNFGVAGLGVVCAQRVGRIGTMVANRVRNLRMPRTAENARAQQEHAGHEVAEGARAERESEMPA